MGLHFIMDVRNKMSVILMASKNSLSKTHVYKSFLNSKCGLGWIDHMTARVGTNESCFNPFKMIHLVIC